MARPDDAAHRISVRAFAHFRKLLPVVIVAAAFVGPMVVSPPMEAMWLSALLVFCCLVGVRTVSTLPMYPAHTFGVEYRVEESAVESEWRDCVRCELPTDGGVHRRYARQIVVLGVPLYTLAWGENDFCDSCLETRYDPEPDHRSAPTRAAAAADSAAGTASTAANAAAERAASTANSAAGTATNAASSATGAASEAVETAAEAIDSREEKRPSESDRSRARATERDPKLTTGDRRRRADESESLLPRRATRLDRSDESTAIELERAFD